MTSPAKMNTPSYDPSVDGLFRAAEQVRELRIVLALTGPSGSGKTYTALTLATELAGPEGRICVVDTEDASSLIYRKRFRFDFANLSAPFMPSNYLKYIQEAKAKPYNVLILDSLTPAWNGAGGVLDIAGGDFRGWKAATPEQDRLFKAITSCRTSRTHIICTIRSKQEYKLDTNIQGKLEIVKLGLEPVQRPGVDYEFDLVGDLDTSNVLRIVKTRYGDQLPMGARYPKPGQEVASLILEALAKAEYTPGE
jgi:hypothetical protein